MLPILAHEGASPETILKAERGVAFRGWRLVTACVGRQKRVYARRDALWGPRPPGTTTWLRGARCTDREAMPEMEARPRPKIAKVERREASVPIARDAGASQAPGTPRYGVSGVHRKHPLVSRRSAPPHFGGAGLPAEAPAKAGR